MTKGRNMKGSTGMALKYVMIEGLTKLQWGFREMIPQLVHTLETSQKSLY
jgi:hypothetical protein